MVDSCSEADCVQRIRNQEHKELEVTNSKIPRQDGDHDKVSLSPSAIPSMEDILTACPDESIVSAEILVQLLRIQSKYLDEHPCLCTSRFRHVLHQLDSNQHKKLAELCGQLRQLTSISSEHLYSTTQYYNTIIQRIFDYESLKLAPYVVERSIEYGSDQALSAKLEAILARLVSDYRAIFAIEEQCVIDRHQKNEDTSVTGTGKAHEIHRKRHEGEDECPEEIKLMKVAWKDLTLHCPATAMTASPLALGTVGGPFPDPSDQMTSPGCSKTSPMAPNNASEGPKSEECTDFIQKYNAIFRSKNQKNDSSQFSKVLQAKCTSSCKARKRKERQETLVEYDSKFSRSSSETWDDSACDFTDSFRRSHSSVDLDYDGPCCVPSPEIQSDEGKKPRNRFFIDEVNDASSGSSNSTLTSSTILGGDVEEASQSSLDKDKNRHSNSGPNIENVDQIKPGAEEPVRSNLPVLPTPTSEPPEPSPKIQDTPASFKFNGWGLQNEGGPIVDQNQEIRPMSWLPPGHQNYGSRPSGSLEDDQMYSSRAMGILRYLDPTPMVTQRRTSDPEATKKSKLRQLKKQLSSVKRKLESLQISFEEAQGYKPSQADKQGDRNMRRLLLEQSQLQRQIRGYRDCDFLEDWDEGSNDSDKLSVLGLEVENLCEDTNSTDGSSGESVQNNNDNNNSHKSKDLEAMRTTLDEIEECLNYQRSNKGRSLALDEMTVEQLHDEKVDLHNAIRQFESAYGAPMDEDEKLVVKSLYDRYRTVKRLVRRSSASRAKDTTELETIPEDEALALTLASPPHRINLEFNGSTSSSSPSGSLGKKRYVEDGLPISKKNTPAEPEVKPSSATSESSGDDFSNDSEGPENNKEHEENQRRSLEAEQYHSMSRFDLLQIFRKTREEKRQLRRLIKEKEDEFQKKTGRRLLREDRDKSEITYKQYKVTKAKVKLIEALLAKRAHEPMF